MKKKTVPIAVIILVLCFLAFSAHASAARSSTNTYVVQVIEEDGKPIPSVMVQFCSDTECIIGKTDEDGNASFEKESGYYTVHILKAADGYENDETEYTAPEVPGLMTIVLKSKKQQGEISVDVPERGICYAVSQEYIDKGLVVEYPNENLKGYPNSCIYYYSPTFYQLMDEIVAMEPLERTPEVEEEYTQKLWAASRCLLEITLIAESEYNTLIDNGGQAEDISYYAPAELLTRNDGYVYIVSIPDLDDGNLNEEEASDYHACKDYMKAVLKKMSFVPIQFEKTETELGFIIPPFTTTDLNGNTVNKQLFTEHELTVVNIWGTFCSPCIAEMPELGEWAKTMDDRVTLVGIVGDIEGKEDVERISLALEILNRARADFINLIPDDEISSMLEGLIAFPTTIFVNSSGAIVGEPIVGADVEMYKIFVEDFLNG